MKFINRNNRKLKKHLKKLSGSIRHVLAVPFLVPVLLTIISACILLIITP